MSRQVPAHMTHPCWSMLFVSVLLCFTLKVAAFAPSAFRWNQLRIRAAAGSGWCWDRGAERIRCAATDNVKRREVIRKAEHERSNDNGMSGPWSRSDMLRSVRRWKRFRIDIDSSFRRSIIVFSFSCADILFKCVMGATPLTSLCCTLYRIHLEGITQLASLNGAVKFRGEEGFFRRWVNSDTISHAYKPPTSVSADAHLNSCVCLIMFLITCVLALYYST